MQESNWQSKQKIREATQEALGDTIRGNDSREPQKIETYRNMDDQIAEDTAKDLVKNSLEELNWEKTKKEFEIFFDVRPELMHFVKKLLEKMRESKKEDKMLVNFVDKIIDEFYTDWESINPFANNSK